MVYDVHALDGVLLDVVGDESVYVDRLVDVLEQQGAGPVCVVALWQDLEGDAEWLGEEGAEVRGAVCVNRNRTGASTTLAGGVHLL